MVILGVTVPASELEYLIGNEVLAGAVTLYDGGHHILRHILVVGKELLGVLGQAVSTVTEARGVLVCTDTGVEADAFDNGG